MRLIYRPEDGDEQSWIFRPGKLRKTVASQLQAVYGKPWEMFIVDVQKGDVDAHAVALWHCMRTDHPLLKFVDLPDFATDEVVVEYEVDELRVFLAQTEANAAAIPADQRAMALGVLRAQLAEAEERDGPKASSTASPTA